MKTFLTVLQVISALGVISTVLLQSGKSAGLSGSIAGGAEQLFGKKKGLDELFSRLTAIMAMLFLVLSLLISVF